MIFAQLKMGPVLWRTLLIGNVGVLVPRPVCRLGAHSERAVEKGHYICDCRVPSSTSSYQAKGTSHGSSGLRHSILPGMECSGLHHLSLGPAIRRTSPRGRVAATIGNRLSCAFWSPKLWQDPILGHTIFLTVRCQPAGLPHIMT